MSGGGGGCRLGGGESCEKFVVGKDLFSYAEASHASASTLDVG